MIIRNSSCLSSNTVDVPRQTSFHVPIGTYSSTIHSVRKVQRFGGNVVRFIFRVNAPSNVDYLAKIDFREDLREGSDLWNVLCRLVGRRALQDCSGQQFNLDSLIGAEADIEIAHVTDHAEDYEFPLVVITDIQEAGRLLKTENENQR